MECWATFRLPNFQQWDELEWELHIKVQGFLIVIQNMRTNEGNEICSSVNINGRVYIFYFCVRSLTCSGCSPAKLIVWNYFNLFEGQPEGFIHHFFFKIVAWLRILYFFHKKVLGNTLYKACLHNIIL